MNDKTKKIVKTLAVAIYIVILLIAGAGVAERAIVKYSAESVLEQIRSGIDDETMNEVVDSLISQIVGNGFIGSKLQNSINGDDVNDIYFALLNGMDYKVYAVEKAGSGNYRVGMLIRNRNNIMVGKEAWEVFKSRYDGNWLERIEQGLEDLNSDWSQLFAKVFIEASQNLESEIGGALFTTQSYVVNISIDGDLYFENQDGEISFLLLCAGVPIGVGAAPQIRDELKIYTGIFVCLLAIPVGLIIYKRKVNSSKPLAGAGTIGKTVPGNDKSGINPIDNNATPVLYAKSAQHNNMPFAVHDMPLFIGRDPTSCKVIFSDGTIGVSSRHCSVSYDSARGDFILTDLRSTYGTYLENGRKLSANTPYHLKSGDTFYLGDKANLFSVELC